MLAEETGANTAKDKEKYNISDRVFKTEIFKDEDIHKMVGCHVAYT